MSILHDCKIFSYPKGCADSANAVLLVNNLWQLVASTVFFMQAGFAMLEAGMCRSKNAVNILATNLFVGALASTAYWFIGYNLMNSESNIFDPTDTD